MTSPLTIGDFKYAPLYFFDQPKRDRSKCARNNLLHFDLGNEGTRIATVQSFHACDTDDNVSKELNSEETSHKLRIEATLEGNHEISIHAKGTTNIINERYPLAVTAEGAENKNQIDAYKYVAPHLLSELAVLLSECAGSEDVCIPHGLVNVLNYSWRDLSSDAIYGKRTSELAAGEGVKQSKSKDVPNFDNTPSVMVVDGPKNTNKKDSVVENVGPKQNNIILYTLRRKPSISNTNRANAPTTLSFSISSKTCKEQGWILQPNELEEPRWTTLYQWVVERLQMARISIKLQTAKQAEQGLDKPLILRCYGEVTPYVKNRKTPGKAKPVTLCNGLPKIPEIKQEDNSQNKLYWRINDGSSFIYYSSGNIAVCQSHSILPSGGFYTNVFSDNASPVIVASITAFGHGTVTHPVSGMITAVWDQHGGLICDPNGSVTTKWTWPTAAGLKEKITVQVSDQISVKLVSANAAILCFTALGDSVQLPLSALPNVIHPKETAYLRTEGTFHSLTAGELSLAKRRKPQSQIIERKRALQLKCVCF